MLYNFSVKIKIPSVTKFMGIPDRSEQLGPPKVSESGEQQLQQSSVVPPASIPHKKEIFLSWEKEMSVEDRKVISKRFSRSFIIIGVAVAILLLLMQQFFVLLVIGSLIFFIQAMGKLSPETVKYEISTEGIMIDDKIYDWDKLRRFFFVERGNSEMIAVDTVLGIPARIFISFEPADREKIKGILEKYLYYLESEPKTFLDNTYDSVVQKFSFREDEESTESADNSPDEKTGASVKE
jgi:hypothetical protein